MATSIYSGAFWKSSTERAVKTGIQTFIPLGGGAAFDLLGIDWEIAGAAVGSAVVLSYLMSIVSGLNGTGPSAVNSEIKADAVVLDEVELDEAEAQKVLDEMVIEREVPDQVVPDEVEDLSDEEDADPEGEGDDESPAFEPTEIADEFEEDADPEGLADDEEEEVDLTPPPQGYVPRH